MGFVPKRLKFTRLPSLMSDEISSKHWLSRVNSLLVLQRVKATEVFDVFLVPIILCDFCGRSYISPKLILNIPIDNKPELGVVFQPLGNGSQTLYLESFVWSPQKDSFLEWKSPFFPTKIWVGGLVTYDNSQIICAGVDQLPLFFLVPTT